MSAVALLVAPVWSAVCHFTFTSLPDAALRRIVNDTFPPSVAVASEMDTVGGSSSSVISTVVSVKVRSPDEPIRDNVSSSSSKESLSGVSVKSTWPEDCPAEMVIVWSATVS